MQAGEALVVHLHAHVTAGDHDTVGVLEDLLEVLDALGVLDLGQDADVVAAVVVQIVAHGDDVIGGAHEGGGDIVYVHLHAEAEVGHIPLVEVGEIQVDTGDIDALTVGNGAARDHGADHVGVGQLLDGQLQTAVVDQHAVALLQLGGEIGIGDGDTGGVALNLPSGQGEGASLLQVGLTVLEGADADLGALGVQHDGGGLAQTLADTAEGLDDLAVGLVIPVGEVETGHVHARLEHFGHDLFGAGGGADGTDDLGF